MRGTPVLIDLGFDASEERRRIVRTAGDEPMVILAYAQHDEVQ